MLRKLAFLGLAAFAGKTLWNKHKADQADGRQVPGHRPTDLEGDTHPDGSARADDHFRPDIHAGVAEADREGLRPATVAAP